MSREDYQGFCDSFSEDSAATLRRFDSLQVHGSLRPRNLLRDISKMRGPINSETLSAGLAWLDLDQRQQVQALPLPQLYLLAENDALVPSACHTALTRLFEGKDNVRVAPRLPGAGHLALLDIPGKVVDEIEIFLTQQDLLREQSPAADPLDKSDVAASFSRSAASYDSVAGLQRDVGTRLLTGLDQLQDDPECILDLGCGTGYFSTALRERFPRADYIGLDLAGGMIDVARQRFPDGTRWIVGDAESLPLAAGSLDLVFSSLAIQWCYRPGHLFAELARILRPGGRCLFTSLGPDTLRELRAAWAAVDEHQHVNTFLPAEALETAVGELPELALGLEAQLFTMEYPRVRDLLAELKTLGAHNVNRDRPTGLTGRRALQGMLDAYEKWRTGGRLPATYDVFFGVVEKT
jgi:malonyl-CoA O-methyltransferase